MIVHRKTVRIRHTPRHTVTELYRRRCARRTLHSQLQEIPGVGVATARKLLRKFGSVARVQKATPEELAGVISSAQAARVIAHFRG